MKAHGGVDVEIQVFSTSALVGGEWSASNFKSFLKVVFFEGFAVCADLHGHLHVLILLWLTGNCCVSFKPHISCSPVCRRTVLHVSILSAVYNEFNITSKLPFYMVTSLHALPYNVIT
jgi:hypothetical protein